MALNDIFQLLIKVYWVNIQGHDTLTSLSEESHCYDALIHFKNYAYERNMTGAISRYRQIADIVLKPLRNRELWSASIENTIWYDFKNQCAISDIKPNEQVDPLKPSEGNKKSLEKFVWDLTDDENNCRLDIQYAQPKSTKESTSTTKTVWGIGDKIAFFYLRDILGLGSNLSPNEPLAKIDDLYLIQPVDIWVERAAKAIGCKEESKIKIATAISSFEHDLGLPPGEGNIAFWMLGSNYVDDKNDFDSVVSAITNSSEKSKEHALIIADYFISYYGKFGELLKSILA